MVIAAGWPYWGDRGEFIAASLDLFIARCFLSLDNSMLKVKKTLTIWIEQTFLSCTRAYKVFPAPLHGPPLQPTPSSSAYCPWPCRPPSMAGWAYITAVTFIGRMLFPHILCLVPFYSASGFWLNVIRAESPLTAFFCPCLSQSPSITLAYFIVITALTSLYVKLLFISLLFNHLSSPFLPLNTRM